MSSVEYLREFVCERLTAAAEEIFGVFKKTIIEYEEEIDRQRRLLDIAWKPDIQLHTTELPQQNVCKKEEEGVLIDQRLCDHERSSGLDQHEAESPQIKEEQEELCTSQEGGQLVVKLETDTFMSTPTYGDSDHSEPETESDHELFSDYPHLPESQDQKKDKHADSGSTRDADVRTKDTQHRSHNNAVYKPNHHESHCNTLSGKESFKCDTCGKAFKFKSKLNRHLRTHTGEKPYSCDTCGRTFSHKSHLNSHTRTHTGERPYICKTCGKGFTDSGGLLVHIRTHTGEKPYLCQTCSKGFIDMSSLKKHMRIHTDERPYSCHTCGKDFRFGSGLKCHMRQCVPQVENLLVSVGPAARDSTAFDGLVP